MEVKLKHPSGRCIQFLDRNGKWKSTGTKIEKEAYAIAQTFLSQTLPDNFGEFAKEVLYDEGPGSYIQILREVKKIRESTIREFREAAEYYVIPYFAPFDLQRITAVQVQTWYINMTTATGKMAAPSTCNHAISALSRIFSHAIYLGKLTFNPCTAVKRKKPISTGFPKFTDEEIEILLPESIPELLRIYKELDIALFMLIALDTGFRPCEIAALNTSNFYTEHHSVYATSSCDKRNKNIEGQVKTTGRGYSERVGFLSDFTWQMFKLVESVLKPGSYIFTKRNGELRGQAYYYRALERAMRDTGIEKKDRSLYSFRSTFFSRFLQNHPDGVAMMLMGHTNWHACYDQRIPEEVIDRAYTRMLSDIKTAGKVDFNHIAREI